MTKSIDFNQELKEMLPAYYHDIMEFNELIKAESTTLAEIDDWLESGLNQTFIETASWGLWRMEKVFGITSDSNKPIDQRRSVLKAKVRGAGVTTADLIREVAESWYNGDILVAEGPEGVSLKFNSNYGVPLNLADVEKALREIIPAHLMITYLFTYLLIREIHNVKTLDEMETLTLDQFAGGA